ncbi:MAG: hypothetical protein E7168_04900 [Firmicutes bacterium]|nr:hypothetical protein [Bacillota bacterium]
MKRALSIIILLMILFFAGQWAFTYFKVEHSTNYTLQSEELSFEVIENYDKELNDMYTIEIKNENSSFSYAVKNKFNKRKNIVEKIEAYQKDGLLCVYPIFLEEKLIAEVECQIDGVTYTYESLKTKPDISQFVQSLKVKGYQNLAWEEASTEETKTEHSVIYHKNILSEDFITLWNYRNVEVITNKNSFLASVSSYEKYDNRHGALVDEYYVMPVYKDGKVFDFSTLLVFNFKENRGDQISLGTTLKQDTYVNGIVDGVIYYTDPDNLIQLSVNPKTEEVEVVGSREIEAKYYDGSWQNVNIYDLTTTEKKFTLNYSNIPELVEKNPVQVFDGSASYYYYTSDGKVYRLNKNNLQKPILLFNAPNIKEVQVIDDVIYFVVNDTLYYYHQEYGIRTILKNNELKYNTKNRIMISKLEPDKESLYDEEE